MKSYVFTILDEINSVEELLQKKSANRKCRLRFYCRVSLVEFLHSPVVFSRGQAIWSILSRDVVYDDPFPT